jgi:hypothetical protein
MPAEIRKKKGKNLFSVRTPGGVKAKATSLRNAKAQQRLLNAIEHGFDPEKAKRLTIKY